MNISNALRILIRDEKKVTQKEFAESIDMPFTTLNTSLRVGNITINKLLKILNALDYEIVLRPKEGLIKMPALLLLMKWLKGGRYYELKRMLKKDD